MKTLTTTITELDECWYVALTGDRFVKARDAFRAVLKHNQQLCRESGETVVTSIDWVTSTPAGEGEAAAVRDAAARAQIIT